MIDGEQQAALQQAFGDDLQIEWHNAPALRLRHDSDHPAKAVMPLLKMLAEEA